MTSIGVEIYQVAGESCLGEYGLRYLNRMPLGSIGWDKQGECQEVGVFSQLPVRILLYHRSPPVNWSHDGERWKELGSAQGWRKKKRKKVCDIRFVAGAVASPSI